MGWESSGSNENSLKSAYNSLIIGPRGLECETDLQKSWAGSLLLWSDLTLAPSSRSNEDSQS